MEHVRQGARWGPLFPVLYLLGLAVYGYRMNPFEVSARKAAVRVLQTNEMEGNA